MRNSLYLRARRAQKRISRQIDRISSPSHVSVLKEEILAEFRLTLNKPNAVCVDFTFGVGGHSRAILKAFPTCKVADV